MSVTDTSSDRQDSIELECAFEEGAAPVNIASAAPKGLERMREKISEYVSHSR